jgi:hypothetical protein
MLAWEVAADKKRLPSWRRAGVLPSEPMNIPPLRVQPSLKRGVDTNSVGGTYSGWGR